jgi:N-acyl-D-amino-acid deacylase
MSEPATGAETHVHDLVVSGGRIVDGTGDPSFEGDIGIDGALITTIGPPAR